MESFTEILTDVSVKAELTIVGSHYENREYDLV